MQIIGAPVKGEMIKVGVTNIKANFQTKLFDKIVIFNKNKNEPKAIAGAP